jgi:hypothetical protein
LVLAIRTRLQHRAQLLLGGHVGERFRCAQREAGQRILCEYASFYSPPEERLQRAVRLVLVAGAVRLQAREERRTVNGVAWIVVARKRRHHHA